MIEETMASVATSQVAASLPSLDPYLEGFQLITNNEEDNSALGVLLALLGDTAIFLPTVFKDGKIEPLDIMYLPEMERLLPAQDNFISMLKSRKTDLVAMLDDKSGLTKGTASNVSLQMPFNRMVKRASGFDSVGEWIRQDGGHGFRELAGDVMLEVLTKSASDGIQDISEVNVPSALDVLSKRGSALLVNTIKKHPSVQNAFARFYTDAELKKLVDITEQHAFHKSKIEPVQTGKVKILTRASTEAKELTDDLKGALIRDGAVIVDTRGLIPSTVFRLQQNEEWQVPGEPGIYELLKRDGNTMTAYVIPGVGSQHNQNGQTTLVVPVDDGQKRIAYKEAPLLAGQMIPFTRLELPDGGTIDTIKDVPAVPDGACYDSEKSPGNPFRSILIATPMGTAYVLEGQLNKGVWVGGADDKVKMLTKLNLMCRSVQTAFSPWEISECNNEVKKYEEDTINTIVKLPKGADLRVNGTSLYVPEDARVYGIRESYGETSPQFGLAQISEVHEVAERCNDLMGVKLFHSDAEFEVTGKDGVSVGGLDKVAAAKHLVENYFVDPDEARMMVKEASQGINKQVRYLLDIPAISKVANAMTVSEPVEYEIADHDLNNEVSDNSRQKIQNAAASGVKEVLDITILKTLAEESSSVHLVQESIPDLFKALDKAARLLYVTRAGDAMVEAYGEGKISALKSRLKKLVFDLGDLIIYLQQGRIDAVHDLVEGPLSSTLG